MKSVAGDNVYVCVCVGGHSNLTARSDLTADASLSSLSADPAHQNVERGKGKKGVDVG